MPRVRVTGFGVSLDGFSAGTEQSLNDPLGKRGPEIFQWFFHTKTFCAMRGQNVDRSMWTMSWHVGRWRPLGPSSWAANPSGPSVIEELTPAVRSDSKRRTS